MRRSIGVVPAWSAWPMKITPRAADADDAPRPTPMGSAGLLEARSLLDVQLDVGVRAVLRVARAPRAPRRHRSRRGPSRRRAARRRRPPASGIAAASSLPRRPASRRGCRSGPPRRSTPRRSGAGACAAPASRMACRHSSPASTPSAPSSGPPSGTVSMCEPVITAGVARARPSAPKMLPAGSTHVVEPGRPSSRRCSHARASSWGGLQHERVMPRPPGLRAELREGLDVAIEDGGREIAMPHGRGRVYPTSLTP